MITYLKKNKLFTILFVLSFFMVIFGFIFYFLIDSSYKEIISNNIELLFQNKLIDMKSFFFNKLFSNVIVWILGISVVGFILVLILYLYKCFIFSFELISLICNINSKNILMIIAYIIPNLLSLMIIFILCYYSISYSIYLSRFLFRNKKYNLSFITSRYIKVLLFTFIGTLICCVLEYLILNHITIIKL